MKMLNKCIVENACNVCRPPVQDCFLMGLLIAEETVLQHCEMPVPLTSVEPMTGYLCNQCYGYCMDSMTSCYHQVPSQSMIRTK